MSRIGGLALLPARGAGRFAREPLPKRAQSFVVADELD
jgi:hypothetical protein